ncbi:hypothetical protein CB1_000513012 [Camelus ferus]|nr:hypothetical protein CB1_000513012 [Camelus ferus]
MEFYESTYFIVLIPSVVITVIFLFFWLFMKETLYDEVLAKQKREQKLIPTKTDKKKAEKKKNKKKEIQNGNLHESDSESVPQDFKLSDALSVEDEQVVPVPLNVAETSSSVRERKKKEKKHKPVLEEQVTKESDVSKIPCKKVEPVPVTKQPTPPSEAAASKKKPGQKKSKNGSVAVLVDEPLIHATTYIPLMDNADANPVVDKRESSKGEVTALLHQLQEKDKLLAAVKEDAAAMKDRCKQLTQEMMAEKERSNVVIARMKDRIGTLEKEHNVFQNKMHVSYQETQQMQMKVQLQEAERRWEEVQSYIRKRTAEHEATQKEAEMIHEKDGKIKSVEELLEAELLKVANKEKTIQDLKQEIEALKEEIGNIQLEKAQQLSITSQVQELQNLLKGKEEQMNTMKTVLDEKEKDLANRGKQLQDLQEENESLKAHIQEVAQHNLKESYSEWLRGFEKKAKECVAGTSGSEEVKLRREREHLEMELEKAEIERSTYVTEVRELKDLLTELQKKLDDSYSEAVRQNEELNLAQQSLDLIKSKIVKAAGDTTVIENSDISSETESSEKETMSVSLNQTVTQLEQLLQAVNQQLTKEKEHYQARYAAVGLVSSGVSRWSLSGQDNSASVYISCEDMEAQRPSQLPHLVSVKTLVNPSAGATLRPLWAAMEKSHWYFPSPVKLLFLEYQLLPPQQQTKEVFYMEKLRCSFCSHCP